MSDVHAATPRNGRRTVIPGDLMAMRPDLNGYRSRWPYLESITPPTDWIKRQTPSVQRAYRVTPDVVFELHGPANFLSATGVLDSGAQFSAFPMDWAEPLGCDLSQAERISALGNGVLADYFIPVEPLRLKIAGRTITLEHPTFGPWHEAILGRGDVFSEFRVTFDERAQEFILDPYDEAQPCR